MMRRLGWLEVMSLGLVLGKSRLPTDLVAAKLGFLRALGAIVRYNAVHPRENVLILRQLSHHDSYIVIVRGAGVVRIKPREAEIMPIMPLASPGISVA